MGFYPTTCDDVRPCRAETPYPLSAKEVSGHRFYMPETGRWTSRDPIGERGGVNVYASFVSDPVNRGDSLGEALTWIQYSTDPNGQPDITANWPTVPPNGVKAAAFALVQRSFSYSTVDAFVLCKRSQLKTTGEARIIVSKNISGGAKTPGNPSHTILQHEQFHVDYGHESLVDFDHYADPVIDGSWVCCSCAAAKDAYVSALWDYFGSRLAEKNASLECSDYSGAEKTHQCNVVLPAATVARQSAFNAQKAAYDAMIQACK